MAVVCSALPGAMVGGMSKRPPRPTTALSLCVAIIPESEYLRRRRVLRRMMSAVPDLLWDDVKSLFDPEVNGALPDVVIEGTTAGDWQVLLDLVQSQGWQYAYSLGGEPMELPSAADMVAAASVGETPELRVRPIPEILMIFRVYQAESIDFDVDLRELQGQERLDVLVDVFRVIGRRLGKSVLMATEGSPGHPDLGFEAGADRVMLMADPGV